MTTRESLVELMGSEDRLEVLLAITGGTFRNGEAARNLKVAEGTMTRARQKAEALVDAIRTGWRDLDGSLGRLGAEVRGLSNKAFRHFEGLRLASPVEYERLLSKHKDLFRALEQLRVARPGAAAASERACKNYEQLFEELGKLEIGEIGGVDPGEVRRLIGEALKQIDAVRSDWRRLADLLDRLNDHDVRAIDLNELRRLTDDGLGLIEVARPKFQRIVELLGAGRASARPLPVR